MRFLSSLPAVSWLALLTVAIATPGASAQDIFVTPIPNVPFSGIVNVERSHVRDDGSIVNFKTIQVISRDGRGRLHNELSVPVSDSKAPQVVRIHLYDPQTRISTMLNPREQTFRSETVNHPPSTAPPALRYASPSSHGLPQNEFTKEEDLGFHEIEGMPAHGIRESQTTRRERDRHSEKTSDHAGYILAVQLVA